MKNIINFNNKGQLHGYQEWYYTNGKLMCKCFFKNNIRIGYEEEHYPFNHKLIYKSFHI